MTLLSCRAPSGDEAKFASPDKIAGTAASTVFCVVAGSNPNGDAILTMRLGVRNCVRAERMFAYMAGSSLSASAARLPLLSAKGQRSPRQPSRQSGTEYGVECVPPPRPPANQGSHPFRQGGAA